mgnify:CR=1 FL=1
MSTASLTCSAASADSHTPSNNFAQQELFGPLPSASKTSSAKPSCGSTGPTRQSSTTLNNSEARNPHSQMELISSAAGSRSRANLGPKPGSKEARRMTVTSGRKWLGLLKSYGLNILLARTCADLLTSQWGSSAAFLTWKASATAPSHLLLELAVSMPRTAAPAFGSSPRKMTPTATANQMSPSMKERDPRSWWPTPVARDYKGQGMSRERRETREPDNLASWTHKYEGSAALNPAFVEWLMGFPAGWTSLTPQELQAVSKTERRGSKPSETPSSQPSSRRSGGRSLRQSAKNER